MSPPRRRSARLAGATASKTKAAAPTLSSVAEQAESPQRSPPKKKNAALSSPAPVPSTPTSSAVKPPHDEMHPSKAHQTMGEPSSALRLGFEDIKDNGPNVQPDTPSKAAGSTSPFKFRYVREGLESELSDDAQQLLAGLKEQTAKFKADLVAQREAEATETDALGRKIARPRGKSGRFSAAHMAEFKKMDSIENHPSAWRAQNGRFQPVVSLKRTHSKTNLNTTPTNSPGKSGLKRSPSKAELDVPTPATPRMTQAIKRKSSRADLDEFQRSPSPKKSAIPRQTQLYPNVQQRVPSKRFKQRMEDDASTDRPVSRDDSSIPRPKSSGNGASKLPAPAPAPAPAPNTGLARLMSPTKASLAHTGKPTISLVKSPSKSDLKSGLPKSISAQTLTSPAKTTTPGARVFSSGRLERVKSFMRGNRTPSGNAQTAIPQPMISQTPAPPKADKDKALPPVPLTTPRRKVTKHVAFTPEVSRISTEQSSPSPQKSSFKTRLTRNLGVTFQGLDEAITKTDSGDVRYPDLSGFRPLPEPPKPQLQAPSVPGKFTFRSDHTIEFGETPAAGFGASPGQSSVRHVRQSLKPNTEMPGSFPGSTAPVSLANKENNEPGPTKLLVGAPHGMSNKKRHRASWDEEEAEEKEAERAAKKRKNEHVPEGEALLAPRLLGSTPSAKKTRAGSAVPRTPNTATPSKKRAVLSLSRLNMLARPKNRV
ncbi:hypothetical protein FSOLCH5_003172 [Fusarium solani]|nr:hypothetical protein NW759_003193 [Fusarium solani]